MGRGNINTSVNEKMPFLSFLAINYNLPVITEVQEWFESCIIRNYANPAAERQIMVSEDEQFKGTSKSTPGTMIYELVEKLRPYLNVDGDSCGDCDI